VAQIYSTRTTAAQSGNGVVDAYGVPLVSSLNDFGASPLGVAARSQALYGIANAQFNLLPREVGSAIVDFQNPLPYWSVNNFSDSRIVPKSFYDTTTGTFSVELDPTAGSAADYLTLKTRSFLLTDDNLALRQKAYLTMSKGTAYSGSTQFNVVLSAEYFDASGASLSTYAIGTALDNGAMTSISGITTSGSAAISASAAYVDFTITLTATATVTSGVKVYLKSFLIATSQAATGSFLIAQTFTSSGTWTRPTGVEYVTVVAMGGGEGGQSGFLRAANTTTSIASGGNGGASGGWGMLRDIYVGNVGSVSVGVGAGGAGGTALTFSKAAAATTQSTQSGASGASGGASTFGGYISVGGGGAPGVTFGVYPLGNGTVAVAAGGNGAQAGTNNALSAYAFGAPFTTFVTGGVAGAAGTGSGGTSGTATAGGTAGTALGIGGGGGGGGQGTAQSSSIISAGQVGGNSGAGAGGGASLRYIGANSQTIVTTGGAGGTALANSGAGGGGGGAVGVAASTSTTYNSAAITMTSGAGGAAAAGFVTVVYVA
jgi:hypothetical protein